MSGSAGASSWSWLAPGHGFLLAPSGGLTFVRGATVGQVFAGFGADAADAVDCSFGEVDPELVELSAPEDLLRVLDTGTWIVAHEPCGITSPGGDERLARLARSADELVSLVSVAVKGFAVFDYYRDGEWIMQREVGRRDAAGTDPGRFEAALARAGLDAVTCEQLPLGTQCAVLLDVVGRELGFALSREQWEGPMRTVTRRSRA